MARRLWVLAAWLLGAGAALAEGNRAVVAVAPFRDGAGGAMGRRVAATILTELSSSRYLAVREESELERVIEQEARQQNTPELFGTTGATARVGEAAAADFIVVGEVSSEGEATLIQARCVRVAEQTIVPGTAFSASSRDWQALAENIAEVLHVKLSGGFPLGLEREDRLVRNDTSDVRLSLEIDRPTTDGKLPIYLKGELMRMTVRGSQAGYLSLIAVGKDEVYQLFPVGPVGRMDTAIAADGAVTLPTPAFAEAGYDPNGFELFGETPGIEKIHAFFCRQPITLMIPDSQANPNLKQMTPAEYFRDFLPRLKQHLASKDRLWNGTSARYFYGVDTAEVESPEPPADRETVQAGDPAAQLTQDRGPEILVEDVIGVWPVENGDAAAAKEGALIDARRNALEQALGVMVRSETEVDTYQLVRDQIQVSSQTGFVRVKEVTEEAERDGTYVVRINALVTTSPVVALLQDNAALRQLWSELEHPRIVCLVEDQIVQDNQPLPGQANPFSYASSALVRRLTDAGLECLEPSQVTALQERDRVQQALQGNNEAAAYLANQLKAELIVLGRARAAVPRNDGSGGLARTSAFIDLSVVNAADASILVQAGDSSVGYYRADDAVFAGREAIVQLVGKLFGPQRQEDSLLARLYGRWMSRPTVFTVKVAGETQARLSDFCDALKPAEVHVQTVDLANPTAARPKAPSLFQAATLRDFTAQVGTLEVRTPLRPGRGLEELSKRFEPFGWEITAVDAGTRIDVRRAGAAPP